MKSLAPWESLNTEELEGERNSCFILTHDNPLPKTTRDPFHRNTEDSEVMDYISCRETSHLTSTPGLACVNASFKSAINLYE